MPFKSEAQKRWMYANRPEMAKEWERETPKKKKLPKRLRKKADIIKESTSKGEIHRLATKANIPWDNDPKFKRWSKKLTGKSHLDGMSRAQLKRMKGAILDRHREKTAATAVIIKGNPEHLAESGATKKTVSGFHTRLKKILQSEGYEVSFDPGLPHTSPKKADVWVGHSRGADRLRFAPKGTIQIPVGSDRPGAINHPADRQWMRQASKALKGRSWADTPVKERPPIPKEHLMVTPKMEKELRSRIKVKAHTRSIGGKLVKIREHKRKTLGHVEYRAKTRSDITSNEISKLRKYVLNKRLRKGETYHYTWPGRGHAIIGDVGRKKAQHVVKTIYKPADSPPGRKLMVKLPE